MPNVLIRDLPETTHSRLKEQADSEGLSMQAYLAQILDDTAGRLTSREFFDRVTAGLAAIGAEEGDPATTLESLDEARSERDARWDRLLSNP